MYKTWLKTFLSVFVGGLAVLVLVNAVADPMLVLPFMHRFNNRVRFINERQQKTNLLYFSHYYGTKDYDGVILGSSRSSGLNPTLFQPYTVFNYAAAASRPQEAASYATFAQDLHGKPLQVIILGLDFMSAAGTPSQSRTKGEPVIYTQDVKKPFYTLANLMNLKAFHLATRNLRANLHPTKENYFERHADAVVEYFRPGPADQQAAFNETLGIYQNIYAQFHYNPDYKTILQEVKNAFPHTRFIVFTTPVAKPHLELLYAAGLADSYKQWLTDIVDVFGEVHHFMDENEVTRNYTAYFADSHHLYPGAADLIAQRIQGRLDGVPADFGKTLTQQTLPAYLANLPK